MEVSADTATQKIMDVPFGTTISREVIDFAQQINAKISLAHPKFLNLDDDKLENLLLQLKDYSLWGVECYYSKHTAEETGKYLDYCKKYNLRHKGVELHMVLKGKFPAIMR